MWSWSRRNQPQYLDDDDEDSENYDDNPAAFSVPPPNYYQHGHVPTFTPPPGTPYTNPNRVARSVPDDVPSPVSSPESAPDGDVPEFISPPETPCTNPNPVAHSVPPRDYFQHGHWPTYPELSGPIPLQAELSERGRRAPEPRGPWRSSSPNPDSERESNENEYDNTSTTVGAAADSEVRRPTYQDSMYQFDGEDPPDIISSTREDPPTHYRFKISSFKTLRESILRRSCKPDYIESTEFYVANFKW
ncbi:hypothetical protein Ancab_017140 [Ancistrocladus abbreviatus]